MNAALKLNSQEGEDNLYSENLEDSLEIDLVDLRLPIRHYQVNFQIAEEGPFSLTTEFILRLLKAVDSITETEISEFFGFSAEEASHVVSAVERMGFVHRNGGFVQLTEAGDSKFENSSEEPFLYKVQRKTRTVAFDLLSFCPLKNGYPNNKFENTLPEIPIIDPERVANATKTIKKAFRDHYQEIKAIHGGFESDRSTIYSIDDITSLNRSSVLVPMSVKILRDSPGVVEPDIFGWKSGVDLEDRLAVLESCGELLKKHSVPVPTVLDDGANYLHECAPEYLEPFFKEGRFDAMGFFRKALSQTGVFRKNRKTIHIYGSLLVSRNFKKILSALKQSPDTPGMSYKPLIWIRPNVPFWGCSTKLKSLVDELKNKMVHSENTSYASSLLLTHGSKLKESSWRFNEIFENISTSEHCDVPHNFELLLMPGRIFAALLHVPLSKSDGYPVPLGILSCDTNLLRGVHGIMTDILSPKRRSSKEDVYELSTTKNILDALALPPNYPGDELKSENFKSKDDD